MKLIRGTEAEDPKDQEVVMKVIQFQQGFLSGALEEGHYTSFHNLAEMLASKNQTISDVQAQQSQQPPQQQTPQQPLQSPQQIQQTPQQSQAKNQSEYQLTSPLTRSLTRWICNVCSLENDGLADTCLACEYKRGTKAQHAVLISRPSPSTPQTDQIQTPETLWSCLCCTFQNSESSPNCISCGNIKGFDPHDLPPSPTPESSLLAPETPSPESNLPISQSPPAESNFPAPKELSIQEKLKQLAPEAETHKVVPSSEYRPKKMTFSLGTFFFVNKHILF